MHLSDKYLATKATISAHLAQLGWQIADAGPIALGTKTFKTAVGEKTAIGYLAPYGEEAAHFQGSYESEGRNVLEAMRAGWKPLTFSETDDELEALAKAFAAEVDAEVSKTYAMRLAAAAGEVIA